MNARKTAKRNRARAVADQITAEAAGLLGVVITWNSGPEGATHKQTALVTALTAAGFDGSKVVRDMLPRNAFARVRKTLEEERVIDVFQETEDELVFQFTKKYLNSVEWQYHKETFVRLNKHTGKVACDVSKVQAEAQRLIDEQMEHRNNTDVTRIVNKLFDDQADLYPMRDAGGVYFVPVEYMSFVDQVEVFLKRLTGYIDRIPVPAGSKMAEQTVQNVMAAKLERLAKEHKAAIETLNSTTRKDTITARVEEINRSRVRVQAYAHYLHERREKLLESLDDAEKALRQKVEEIGGGVTGTKYDWDAILDGKAHKLVQGEDFDAKAATVLDLAIYHAKKRGMKVRSRTMEDGTVLILQAVPKD